MCGMQHKAHRINHGRMLREAKDDAFRSGDRDLFSAERPAEHHGLQETNPSSCGEPKAYKPAKQVLLQKPRPHFRSARRRRVRYSRDRRSGRHQAQTACPPPA
ncbi:uncharacterized protein ACBT44_006686 [Syngnathus typhle]